MGRKRLSEGEKKVDITLKIKKEYVDILKDKQVNISKLVEEFIKNYLNK